MTSLTLTRLTDNLRRLKLHKTVERLETLLQEASAQELGYADSLDALRAEDTTAKTEQHITMRTAMARFPCVKTLEGFDFGCQPSIDKKKLLQLATGRFIEHGENVVLVGPPGMGKTQLAMALGLKAIQLGFRTLFTGAMHWVAGLVKAYAEGRYEVRLKLYSQPKLLIIDEIGYIPMDPHGGHLFFQLISRRYERGSIILTSIRGFGQWGEVFGDPVLATAILDRLLHHSLTVIINWESYRLKEKQQAGFLGPTAAPSSP